ncbi:ABC transporter substrate-binding protein [Jatrophihabitans sp.]|uniref:ABC transporter substrate-binding protein n=1 Tax=Jatrophihabitans sp. TaxID=1932789 RepID=UPI0030C69B9E|nr:extracellular solute-binding protein family 3 [Jatrophihabitans sp.]
MSRLRLAPALISIAAVSALALTGCSSSGGSKTPAGGSSGSTSSTSSTAASSSSAASGAAALVPASIKSKGSLTIAMDATYAPDESIDTDGKTIIGFDADLAKAVSADLGLKADLVNATFDTIIPGLQSGKFDVGFSSFTDTKDREKTVDFVTYFQAGEGFYVKAGSSKKFDGLASLCNASVAVEKGTTEESDAQAQGKKCKVTVLSFPDQNAANLAVSSGRAEVGFVDSQIAGYIVKQSNGQFALTGTAFEVAPYGIALPKGNGMTAAVLQAVKDLIANGTYKTILTKWGVADGAITTPVINGAQS